MKLLIVFDCFRGGAGRVVSILLSSFPENYEVGIIETKKSEQFFFCPERVKRFFYDCEKKDTENYFHYIKRASNGIKEIINTFKPDIVLSFLNIVNTLTCISLRHTKIPLVVSERSNPLQEKIRWKFQLLRFIAYHRANLIVVQNSLFASFYNGYFKNKTVVIPNPVSPRARKKDEQGVISSPRIIAVGNLSPWKKYDRMIHLFSKFHDLHGNAVLTIYGDGAAKNRLRDLIKQKKLEDYISLPGHVSNIDIAFSEADIFWMTSEREGFPNALCEAMSAGLPCVMFECHIGLRDIIQNGENGFLIPYKDDEEFIRTTEMICQNKLLRNKIEDSASKLSERYNEETVVGMWEKAICNLMEN